jgi:kumamolisin
MLDLEVAGAVANGADLIVYFAPNTDRGFVDAVSAAVHDPTHAPAVISISWGGPESSYAAATRQAFEDVLQDAALAGVTVCAAAGDSGSSDGTPSGQATVDYPAASPQVLACGGTSLVLSGSSISSEVVWNDGGAGGATGGGVSTAFALPSWQEGVGVPPSAAGGASGRGVPDVAGNADPATGYRVRIDGADTVIGGTSAVAPLWAALVALAAQRWGRPAGFLNPRLYSHFGRLPSLTAGFHDIVSGDNGAYSAAPGWDACTGLGSPRGAALVQAIPPA